MTHQWRPHTRRVALALGLAVASCSPIHFDPLLGPVATSTPPQWQQLSGPYSDPQGRFTVLGGGDYQYVTPRPDGAVFTQPESYVGAATYGVMVYERPPGPAQVALLHVALQVEAQLRGSDGRLRPLLEQPTVDRGRPALDFYVELWDRPHYGSLGDRRFLSRFVEFDGRVYWMYYSYATFRRPEVVDEDVDAAREFFKAVQWRQAASSAPAVPRSPGAPAGG